MIKTRRLGVTIAVAAVALVALACSDGEAANSVQGGQSVPTTRTGGQAVGPGTAGQVPVAAGVRTASSGGSAGFSPQLQTGGSGAGIWVTGEGTISLEPDLALLNIGVETTAASVAEARSEAARAMDAIAEVLRARGISQSDIQTRFFNISPQYQFTEVVEDGLRSRKQVLVGYRVSNSTVIKIRELDAVGSIIDEVADAGGDPTRINGISFTVEDTKPMMADLREQAVRDAMAKAEQFSNLTGVNLGQLLFISESSGGRSIVTDFAQGARAEMAIVAPSTTISGGELELRMTVHANFAIQ